MITLEQVDMLINTVIAATSIWFAYKKSDASRPFKKNLGNDAFIKEDQAISNKKKTQGMFHVIHSYHSLQAIQPLSL